MHVRGLNQPADDKETRARSAPPAATPSQLEAAQPARLPPGRAAVLQRAVGNGNFDRAARRHTPVTVQRAPHDSSAYEDDDLVSGMSRLGISGGSGGHHTSSGYGSGYYGGGSSTYSGYGYADTDYADTSGWGPEDQLYSEMQHYGGQKGGGQDGGDGRRKSKRGKEIPDNGLTNPILSLAVAYNGDAVQSYEEKNTLSFNQHATLQTPTSHGKAESEYIFKQRVMDRWTGHWYDEQSRKVKRRTQSRPWAQDKNFKPNYDDVMIATGYDSITFMDQPGFSSSHKTATNYFVSDYQISFQWTVKRRHGNGRTWESPIVTHRFTSAVDEEAIEEGEWSAEVHATPSTGTSPWAVTGI